MPGVGFAERYVIARESNMVRVDFARRPDPPAPRFPGAGGLRPHHVESRCNGLQQVRCASACAGEWDGGVLCCVVSPPPVRPPASGKGVAPAFELLELQFGQERRKRPCGPPCFRSPSSSPLP
jgi:hypothetical protein